MVLIFSPSLEPLCMSYGGLLKTRNASGFDLVFWSLWSHCSVWKILDRVCRLYAGKDPNHHRGLSAHPQHCTKLTAQSSRINVQVLCLWIQITSASSAYAKDSWRHWFSRWRHFEIMGRWGWGGSLDCLNAWVPPPEILIEFVRMQLGHLDF